VIEYLHINEVFDSIQGAGRYIGLPVTFLRLAFCDLRCPICDTKYAWDRGVPVSVNELAKELASSSSICITGGEPLLQQEGLIALCRRLPVDQFRTLETNGLRLLPYQLDVHHVAMAPKTHVRERTRVKEWITTALQRGLTLDIKPLVATAEEALYWIDRSVKEGWLSIASRTKSRVLVYLQPAFLEYEHLIPELIQLLAEKAPEWRLSLQVHKLIRVR